MGNVTEEMHCIQPTPCCCRLMSQRLPQVTITACSALVCSVVLCRLTSFVTLSWGPSMQHCLLAHGAASTCVMTCQVSSTSCSAISNPLLGHPAVIPSLGDSWCRVACHRCSPSNGHSHSAVVAADLASSRCRAVSRPRHSTPSIGNKVRVACSCLRLISTLCDILPPVVLLQTRRKKR